MNAEQLSQSIFLCNKYSRWYWAIIQNALMRNKPEQSERHHILPKGRLMFPEYKSLKENPWNGVYLTLREHYLCHLLLTKMTIGEPRRSAIYGLMRFSSGIEKCNSHRYEKAKSLFRSARHGCPNPLKGQPGRKWSKEEKQKHSEKMKEVMNAAAVKTKCSIAKMGKPGHSPSESHRAAISFAQRNLSQIERKRKSDAKLGEKNGCFGKIWVTDGQNRKLVSPSAVPDGYYQRLRTR